MTHEMPAYQQAAGYREMVIAMQQANASFPPVLPELAAPAVSCIAYTHLGLVCRDVAASVAFYAKLGFERLPGGDPAAAKGDGVVRLLGAGGLELHLVQADDCSGDQNILMDFAELKPPGHTHASWTVPSVPGVKDFLASQDIPLSGLRSTLAVFVRDTDRTTLEFERNDGGDEPPETFTSAYIGNKRPLDHVGIRTRAPHARHLEFYARNLGFIYSVRVYDVNPDPLKNGAPMITRTATHCDINFIPNANSVPPEAGEAAESALCSAAGVLKPGILFAAFSIDETDVRAALERLRANGVDAVLDTELKGCEWGGFPASAVKVQADAPTILMRDLNGNLVRLVPSRSAA